VLGDDALAVLKDIKRWLRLYDDRLHRLDVARLLADANLVKGDLLEILATWPEDGLDNTFRAKIALLCGMYSAIVEAWIQLIQLSGPSHSVDLADSK